MDDQRAPDSALRRRPTRPRRLPDEDHGEMDTTLLVELLADQGTRADAVGSDGSDEASPPGAGSPVRGASAPEGQGAERPLEPGEAVIGEDEPWRHFRTPEELLAEELPEDALRGGDIWVSAGDHVGAFATDGEPGFEDELAD